MTLFFLAGTLYDMDIHARIKQKRLEKKFSLEELAQKVGVKSWQAVQHWERPEDKGGTAPHRNRLPSVAKALGVSPEWLQFGDEAMSARKRARKSQPLSALEQKLISQHENLSMAVRQLIQKLIDADTVSALPNNVVVALDSVLGAYLELCQTFPHKKPQKTSAP
ncbi:helix-turn-helix domain-containing protein [Mycoavidus sp. B2-EB]|uniref:helix-turn-helix domain-containing protein n=1 Tax=Mycoavidus sp. B2-EB TaxID=2651972 RepID=UPI0016262017|nr:helix-turn-helix transcriptional regulator [Mycoavidus sp. B2-EB]BBO59940.1 XRE family transcriptional regulator [Mycoavidus sp. B2-EB]